MLLRTEKNCPVETFFIHRSYQQVCAFVTSRLDYCNSIFAGLPSCRVNKLQQIQNHAARLVAKASKREHVSPILSELHWLPLESRIEFKISCIAFQCLSDPLCPIYLKDLIKPYAPSRSLRSSNENFLVTPRNKLRTFGYRSFPSQGPLIWNKLPRCIRTPDRPLQSFKRNLKTHLFKKCFYID